MIYFYELAYTTWEHCPSTIICHDNQFTKDEFNEMVLSSFVKVNEIQKEKHNSLSDPDLSDLPVDEREFQIQWLKYRPSVSNMYDDVIETLISDYGFKSIVNTQQFIISDQGIVPDYGQELQDTSDDCMLMLRERLNVIEPRDNKIKNILENE